MDYAVATDDVSSEEVSAGELHDHLGPPCDVERPVSELEGVVPDYALVHLLAFVGMLRYSRFVALFSVNQA